MRIKKIRQSLGAIGNVADSYTTDSNACYNAPYVNNLHTYSTDEIQIGTFLGKPLYRKVIENTGYATTLTTPVNGTIDSIVNVQGMVKRGDYSNYYMPIPSRASESTYKLDFQTIVYSSKNSNITVNFLFGTGIENMIGTTGKIIIILEYTKN